jgi:hypothetical protein
VKAEDVIAKSLGRAHDDSSHPAHRSKRLPGRVLQLPVGTVRAGFHRCLEIQRQAHRFARQHLSPRAEVDDALRWYRPESGFRSAGGFVMAFLNKNQSIAGVPGCIAAVAKDPGALK